MPVVKGVVVDAMSIQVKPSVDDCHFCISPVLKVNVIDVPEPEHIGDALAAALPPAEAGLTVTLTVNELPEQVADLGVTVYITLIELLVVLTRFPVVNDV